MGRKSFKIPVKPTIVYLSQEQLSDISFLVGDQLRSKFVREAVDSKIKRDKKKLKKFPDKANTDTD